MLFSKNALLFGCFLSAFFFVKCQNEAKNDPMAVRSGVAKPSLGDSVSIEKNFVTGAAAVGRFDSIKKFIRTAELRFQVENVVKNTLEIEKIATNNGGFIAESNLENELGFQKTVPISRDSAIETTEIGLKSNITLYLDAGATLLAADPATHRRMSLISACSTAMAWRIHGWSASS